MMHNHGVIQRDDVLLMWAMINGKSINWPFFIVGHMLRINESKASMSLGYAMQWATIFDYFDETLGNDKLISPTPQSCISDRTLKQMKRNEQEEGPRDEVQEEMDRVEEEEQPQADQPQAAQPQGQDFNTAAIIAQMQAFMGEQFQEMRGYMDRRFEEQNARIDHLYASLGLPPFHPPPPPSQED